MGQGCGSCGARCTSTSLHDLGHDQVVLSLFDSAPCGEEDDLGALSSSQRIHGDIARALVAQLRDPLMPAQQPLHPEQLLELLPMPASLWMPRACSLPQSSPLRMTPACAWRLRFASVPDRPERATS